jgi:peptide/nickel transport system permease protein
LVLRTTSGRIGLPIVLVHAVIFVAGSWLAPYSFTSFNLAEDGTLEQLVGPSRHFLLGTDQFGRDILSRVMSGSTSLIAVAGSGTLLGIAMGSIVGMGSAYMGKWVDEVVMRIMDGLMSFPSLLMALLVISALGPNVLYIVATVAIVTTPGVARVMRSATLTLKEQEFVQSARLRGESAPYIIFREILPNTLPVMGVELTVRLSYSILIVASLGFLGLGVQPPSPDWGLMISQGRQFLSSAPWVALAPAGAVASLIVGVNLLTDGIRQASNMPREVAP